MRKHGRRDAQHAEIRQVFVSCGWQWRDTADLGDDFPDALVFKAGHFVLLEIKSGKAKLKPGQAQFAQSWPVTVVRSVEDAQQIATQRVTCAGSASIATAK